MKKINVLTIAITLVALISSCTTTKKITAPQCNSQLDGINVCECWAYYLDPDSSYKCTPRPVVIDTSTVVWGYYNPGIDWKSILLKDTTNTIYYIKIKK